MKRPSFRTFRCQVAGRSYSVESKIIPGRAPAHVGADSPAYLDPGALGRIQLLRVLNEHGIEVEADRDLEIALTLQCMQQSGLSSGVAKPRGTQMSLPLGEEGGRFT